MQLKFSLLFLILFTGLQITAQHIIGSKSSQIHYMGRVDQRDSVSLLSWSGTSLSINFTGTGVKATMDDELGQNYYNVIVDGKVVNVLHLRKGKMEYTLAAGLPAGKHSMELFKRTEWEMGRTMFFNFVLSNDGRFLPPRPAYKRKMEFFGNSISCALGVEDTSRKDNQNPAYENNYLSYAALTARHFDAEYYCTAKSGIGMLVSWFPLIMPEMYDRIDGADPSRQWEFSKYTPDLVVINLFQNDAWLTKMPQHPQFKARFGDQPPTEDQIVAAYRAFVRSIRNKYPTAKIICTLGNMDAVKTGAPWFAYIEKAVSSLNDKGIYLHSFVYKNTPAHPNVAEQQEMADDLIKFIGTHIKW